MPDDPIRMKPDGSGVQVDGRKMEIGRPYTFQLRKDFPWMIAVRKSGDPNDVNVYVMEDDMARPPIAREHTLYLCEGCGNYVKAADTSLSVDADRARRFPGQDAGTGARQHMQAGRWCGPCIVEDEHESA